MANAAVDASEFIKNLLGTFAGSGTTTSSETKTSPESAGANASIDQLLATIMPQITGTDSTDAIVQNIMSRAAQSFAPISFQGNNASGLYNNSAVSAMKGEAMARATGEASTAVLAHQTDAAKIAAQLTGQKVTAAGQTTTTNKTSATAPAINPKISGAVAAAMAAKSAFAKKKEMDAEAEAERVASGVNATGGRLGAQTAADANPLTGTSSSQQAAEFFTGEQSAVDSSISVASPDVASSIASSITGEAAGLSTAGDASLVDVNGTYPGVEGYLGPATAGDAALLSGVGDATSVGVGTAADLGLAGDAGLTLAADAGGLFEAGEGAATLFEVAEVAAPFSSIVCYELVATGFMQKELADISSSYAKNLNPAVIRGYHYACPWLLKMMRKHKWAHWMLKHGSITRAKELQDSNFIGKIMRVVFEPICYVVGKTCGKDAPLQINITKMLIKVSPLFDLPEKQ